MSNSLLPNVSVTPFTRFSRSLCNLSIAAGNLLQLSLTAGKVESPIVKSSNFSSGTFQALPCQLMSEQLFTLILSFPRSLKLIQYGDSSLTSFLDPELSLE